MTALSFSLETVSLSWTEQWGATLVVVSVNGEGVALFVFL